MDKSQKEDCVKLAQVVLCSPFWISWHLKMEPIGSPKMAVRN